MFDERQFRAAVCLAGKSMQEVAEAMGISRAALYKKLSGESDFSRGEIQKYCEFVQPADMKMIFFSEKVS
ncbi:MAG: helix-turn-helix transcriptional regulator [Christensenellaceae bacterium]|nr:helix-turn-helix transcriptional regulator [Christensenellaceae bacterium]